MSSVNESDAAVFAPTPGRTTMSVAPFNLGSETSKVVRLLLLSGISVIGSVGNIFMISSIMIEDHLSKRGNAYLVNLALADLLVTGMIIPASTVVILADLQDSFAVCKFQWFLAILCCLVTILTLTAVAAENYARLCLPLSCYSILTPPKITISLIAIWLMSCLFVSLQFIYDLGPNYCSRSFAGFLPYHALIGVIVFVLPTLLTLSYYVKTIICVGTARSRPSFQAPIAFNWDYALMKTNLFSFIIFMMCWTPFMIILSLSSVQPIPDRLFDNFTCLALSKSCINCFFYCLTNRYFRNAYINLFQYCCCKTNVSSSRRPRIEPPRPTGDVRVHIIPGYNMYSYTSPQRGNRDLNKPVTQKRNVSSCRPSSSRGHGRDVYEL